MTRIQDRRAIALYSETQRIERKGGFVSQAKTERNDGYGYAPPGQRVSPIPANRRTPFANRKTLGEAKTDENPARAILGRMIEPPVEPIGKFGVLLENGKVWIKRLNPLWLAGFFVVCMLASGALVFVGSNNFPVSSAEFRFVADDLQNDMFAFISPVEEALPGEDEEPYAPPVLSVREYTVRKGDNLGQIAIDSGVSMDSIISLNGISNAKRIIAGTKLKLPNMTGLVYKVKKGDSLESISKTYKLDIAVLADANDLQSNSIQPGQTLFIPGARMSSSELKRALGELMLWPTSGRLTSYYGYRKDPFTGIRQFHNGLDIAGWIGKRVDAVMDGVVVEAGYSNVFGNYVIINHADGYQTLYGHLSKITAKKGQSVGQGWQIGLMGTSGYSTGPHLHFGVFKGGKSMDPLRVLK